MHSTVDCSSTTAAISVGFEYLTSLVAMDGSAPLKDCAVNATGYTNCVTAQNATGTFTMISNAAATSLFMVCNPPLADGESVDLQYAPFPADYFQHHHHSVYGRRHDGYDWPLQNDWKHSHDGGSAPFNEACWYDCQHCSLFLEDKLYTSDDVSFTLVDTTSCLAPTEPPTEAPTEAPAGSSRILCV